MRHLAPMLIAVALLGCLAAPASAQRYKYPPGPPYRTCPDTLSIFDVQQADTVIAPCHPATLDTVWGVRGVITGFDARSSAFGFYAQTAGGGAFTGIDVFTGATNYNGSVPGTPTGGNLVLGDLVVVYGTTQEFPASNGETEIEGPDVSQSTNDIIIRKLSGGNALPPFRIGTTHDFNWVPGSAGNLGEQYEGCLVKIRGPLHVGRNAGSGVAGNTWLIVSNAAPAPDSVLIDGFTLCVPAVTSPAVGTVIDSVQGILNQRNSTTGTGSVNSYRIQLRDGNDVFLATPPGLGEAYPIEDTFAGPNLKGPVFNASNTTVRLKFDRNVDVTTAETEGNYSLGSGIDGSTVDVATVVSGNTVDLQISSVLTDGDVETITAQNIGSATCPACLSASQTLTFINGVLTIAKIQAPDPANLNPCNDRSRFAGAGTAFGNRLTFRGIATQSYGSLYYIQDEAGGLRSGVSVFGPSSALTTGHRYRVAARVQEFGGETEIVNTVEILDEGTGTVPAPVLQSIGVLRDTTCDANPSPGFSPNAITTGEDYEGMLVRVDQARVAAFANPPRDPAAGGAFLVFTPINGFTSKDTILVSSLGGHYTADVDTGDVVDVAGVLHFDNGTFRILPRGDSDISNKGALGVGGGALELALRVSPNPGTIHRVSFALPKKSQVDLGVFDLSGRRVAVIARGEMEAGAYTRVWDGRGSQGARVGPGVYFYRLRVGGEVRLSRAVKLD